MTNPTLSSQSDVAEPIGTDRAASDNEQQVFEALASSVSITANYNRGSVVLEPVLLFKEHEALFLVASPVERNGQPPREPKLGTFRLSGLTGVRLTYRKIDRSLVVPPDWAAGRQTRTLISIARDLIAQVRDH